MTARPSRLSKDNPALTVGKNAPFLGGISAKHYLTNARDKERQDLSKRIEQLDGHIERNLRLSAHAYASGKRDSAIRYACVVSTAFARRADLIATRAKLMAEEPRTESHNYRPGTRVKTKVRRYRSIMDGAKANPK